MKKVSIAALLLLLFAAPQRLWAQLDVDALFMDKGDLCTGPMYSYSAWKNYWEGTLKRENLNLGTVSTQTIGLMGMYGIKKNLAVFYNAPYVITNASAGQWKGQQGFQDLSLWLKYKPHTWDMGDGKLSVIGLLGVSTPMSNYSKDMLPFSIGLGSTNLSTRLMADYINHNWFVTASATYVWRSNVTLDRTAYYTTSMHYSDEVEMPNATQWNLRMGYRTSKLVAEAVIDNWTTQGGNDITRNNMPFITNRMNATRVGFHFKKEEVLLKPLTVLAGGNYVVAGRNVGQSTTVYAGLAWIFHFAKQKPAADKK
ncbi:MAG TPA: hypothetical protein VLL95_13300 [Phnomibacter sp.]|nr:hypothetical protein [Phnomibacter sp.]